MNEAKKRRLRDRVAGAATLINEGCKITGVIGGTGNFMVSGEVDGDCDLQGTLTVTDEGVWLGTIRAETVIISGRVEGDITASGKVEITSSAKIAGNVTADAIAVAEGAVVDGNMQTTGQSVPLEFIEKRKKAD